MTTHLFYVLLSVHFLFAWSSSLAAAATLIEDKTTIPVLTPAFAGKTTARLRLENGLQAYVVSDPYVNKSSAALVVKTGSWEDPVDAPGIAHFLEHMLFLGNQKYPNETEYDQYLTEHGGQFNAFTSNDFTGYVFTVDNSALPGALDRFSSFFKTPLFNPSGVDRELQAINQEYAKNLEDDDIRECYVRKELSDPAHPNHAFGMGNRSSLQKVSQNTLKDWYKNHYSANRMLIEVISNQPLEELKRLVIEDFSDIPNRNIATAPPSLPTIPNSIRGHFVYIEPVKNIRRLVLVWELPSKFAAMRDTKPELLVCHLLSHEGKNSLAAELKREKLVEKVICETDRVGGNSFVFQLQFDLTDAGVRRVEQVILRTFEAIGSFQRKGIPNHLVEELKTITKLDYQYLPREEAFKHIFKQAILLSDADLATFPEQSLVFQHYDQAATKELLAFLTPENCLFELIAPQPLTGVPFERKEKWLGAAYTLKAIPEKALMAWKNAAPNSKIDLPELNPYLPDTTDLLYQIPDAKEQVFSVPHPTSLLNDDNGLVYFAQDSYYQVPTISWMFEIKTPAIDSSKVESIVLGDLFVKYVNESLSDYTYPASLGGISTSIETSHNGLMITVNGYHDKAPALFLDLIKGLKQLQPREKQFKAYKEFLIREYHNDSIDMPILQTYEILSSVLYKNFPLSKAKCAVARKVTFEQFQDFSQKVFEKAYIEGMIYGNMTQGQAEELVAHFTTSLNSHPYPKSEQPKEEVILLPQDQGPFFVDVKSKVQGNATALAIENPPFTFKGRAAQQILMQAMREPFFSTLRTKQQTGYLVRSKDEELEQHLFDTFAVQSNTHDGRDLLARFELFIEGFLQELGKTEVTKERFNTIKKTLVTTLRQPPQSMEDLTMLLDRLAFYYGGDFDRVDKRIKGFEELSYEEFLKSSQEVLGKDNKKRVAVIFTGSTPEENLKYRKLCNTTQLKDLSTYQPFQDAPHE